MWRERLLIQVSVQVTGSELQNQELALIAAGHSQPHAVMRSDVGIAIIYESLVPMSVEAHGLVLIAVSRSRARVGVVVTALKRLVSTFDRERRTLTGRVGVRVLRVMFGCGLMGSTSKNIDSFGRRLTARFQKGTSFIILMASRTTTVWRIWLRCLTATTTLTEPALLASMSWRRN